MKQTRMAPREKETNPELHRGLRLPTVVMDGAARPGQPPPGADRRPPTGSLLFTEPLPDDAEHMGIQVPAEQSPKQSTYQVVRYIGAHLEALKSNSVCPRATREQ